MKRALTATNYNFNIKAGQVSADVMNKKLPNGYLTCSLVEKHTKTITDCVNKYGSTFYQHLKLKCGLYPSDCRYVIM